MMASKVWGLVPVDVCAAARASIIDEVMQVGGTDHRDSPMERER
jgi:hypothetical protein